MATPPIDDIEAIQYEGYNFPVGTPESLALVLVKYVKLNERVRVRYKTKHSKTGYVKVSTGKFLILCFDSRSCRGAVLGLNIVCINGTRKPYPQVWSIEDDPVAFIMDS